MAEATSTLDEPVGTDAEFKPPSDPATPADDLTVWLEQLNNIEAGPHVYNQPISFANGLRKANWKDSLPDINARSTVSNFWKAPRRDKKSWLALLSHPSMNWVGVAEEQWDAEPWHCQAVAVISNPRPQRGKHLVVFNPDPAPACEESEANLLLVRTARSIFQWAREHKCPDLRLWYSTTTEYSEKDKCLQNSLEMLHRWARMGDMAWQGPGDPRMKDCVEVKRV